MPRPPLRLDASRTALLLVECQNGIVGRDSALPELARAAAPMLPTLGRLTRGLRDAGAQIMHLVYVPALGNRSSNRMSSVMAHALSSMDDWTDDHPATQVVDEVGVGPGDLILRRNSGMSPTYHTEVFPMLRNAGFDTVVLAGVSLNIAVPIIAAQAVDELFAVVVARDAAVGTPVEHGESMLKYTLAFLGAVASTDEILAAASSVPAAR